MAQVSDLIAWKGNMFVKRGQVIQWKGIPYRVLSDHKTPPIFNLNDSRLVVDLTSGGGGGTGPAGRGVEDATVNEDGDLIITYTDDTLHNAGHVVGVDGSDKFILAEALTVATDQPSATAFPIDGTKPVVVYVNGLAYASVSTPAPFTVAASTITWDDANAGIALDSNDSVFVAYTRT